MKKILTFVLLVLCAASIIMSCKSAPPPELILVEELMSPPPPPPAPPPPPPPPEPEEDQEDTPPPEISVSLFPQPFSPDGDGVDDLVTVTLNIKNQSPIHAWRIEIRDPAQQLFSEWSGEGEPEKEIIWDGRSADGELVQSASTYYFGISVVDIHGKSADATELIRVDVLVQREGDILRVIVPSIVFAPNSGEFIRGLDPNVSANNERILQRIAEVLNQFDTYRITVEGHANPTTAPGTRARTQEETGTRTVLGLKPLSQMRAQAVVDYLVSHGVDRGRLAANGVGSARTVVDFADRDNWWKNRRVEFILEKPNT